MFGKHTRERMVRRFLSGGVHPYETIQAVTTVVDPADSAKWWNLALVDGWLVKAKRDGTPEARHAKRIPLCGITWLGVTDKGARWNMVEIGDDTVHRFCSRTNSPDKFPLLLLKELMSLPAAEMHYELPDGPVVLYYEPFRPGRYARWHGRSAVKNWSSNNELLGRAVEDFVAACTGIPAGHVRLSPVPELVEVPQMTRSWIHHHLDQQNIVAAGNATLRDGTIVAIAVTAGHIYLFMLRSTERWYPPSVSTHRPDEISFNSNGQLSVQGLPGSLFVNAEDFESIAAAIRNKQKRERPLESESYRVRPIPPVVGSNRRLGLRRPH